MKDKIKQIVSRVKFLVYINSYRLKKAVVDYFTNREIINSIERVEHKVKIISNQIQNDTYTLSSLWDERIELYNIITKLERKVKKYEQTKTPKRTGKGRNSKNSRRQNSSRSRK